ncbi:MAG TPA: DUF1214 domain-containing protein [Panacibacter sp.]|nr:DUF1214 domain-containing protein [Panacibacter sp.]
MKLYFVIAVTVFELMQSTAKAQTKMSTDSLLHVVKEAYIYGYPVEQSYRMYVTIPDNTGQTHRLYNHFSYADKLAVAANNNSAKVSAYKKTRNRGGAGPNNDTPYFGSLLDLSEEPLVLSIPDFGSRYFSFQFIDFYNRNLYYIGSSFGDTTAAKYLLIGPNWKGKIPDGLRPVHFKDNHLNLFGRVLVEDDSVDIKNIVALQHQASLTALSKYPAEENKYAGIDNPDLPSYYENIDSFFTNLTHALQLSPAPSQDKSVLKKLSFLGIGTARGFSWNNYDAATRQRIHQTLLQTDSLLDAEGASGDVDFGNGWQRTNPKVGNWGTDYWDEALYIKHGFYAGHTQTEAFYIIPKSREGYGFFKGDHKYKVHFAKDSFPPLKEKGFWSMTAYEIPGYFLLPNPSHRAAIRDRTKNLKYNADGSLDIYLQADSPGKDKESNWLPITKGESTVTFRVYLPKQELLNGTYRLPPIQTIE